MQVKFYLDKTFKSAEDSKKAKQLIKDRKKIPKSLYQDKETSIYIACTINGKYIKVNTGLKIKPFYFDVRMQKMRSSSSEFILIELAMKKISDRFWTEYHNSLIKGTTLATKDVKEILTRAVRQEDQSKKEVGFYGLYSEFLDYKERSVKKKTMYRYKTFIEIFHSFEADTRIKLDVDEISPRLATELTLFLQKKYGYSKNSVVKYLKQLKSFAKYCFEYEYSQNQKYRQIKTSEDSSSIFVLEEHEIHKILELPLEDESWKEIRDAFCFLCYTGQRYSDLKSLKWKDLYSDGKYSYWRLYQYKTGSTQHIDIPLLPEALDLINQRINENPDAYIFNVISNQKMNKKLKKISKLADIKGEFTTVRNQGGERQEIVTHRWEKVTTHVGRKSFITNAIKRGMSISMVQKISGHASLKSMKPYIYLSGNDVASELFKCFTDNEPN